MITAERRLLAALNVPYQPLIHSPTPRPSHRKPMHREVLEPLYFARRRPATSWSPFLPAAAASWSPSLPTSARGALEPLFNHRRRVYSWNPSLPTASLTSVECSYSPKNNSATRHGSEGLHTRSPHAA
jgi:hypothetical protein